MTGVKISVLEGQYYERNGVPRNTKLVQLELQSCRLLIIEQCLSVSFSLAVYISEDEAAFWKSGVFC